MSDGVMFYGVNSIKSVFLAARRNVSEVFATEDAIKKLPVKLKTSLSYKIKIVKQGYIDNNLKLKGLNHQGIAFYCSRRKNDSLDDLLLKLKPKAGLGTSLNVDGQKPIFLLILNKVTDVGNIGAIIRNAVAFGVDMVIADKSGMPDIINSHQVLKASAGLSELIKITQEYNLKNSIDILLKNELDVFALDGTGKIDIRDVGHSSNRSNQAGYAIILGSEGSGIDQKLLMPSIKTVKIPMSKNAESLNVSSASAIALFCVSSILSGGRSS